MEQSAKVNTILKCFVDMNLETNEMFPYDIQMLSVSFLSAYYTVNEDESVSVTVSLNEPSRNGIEELDVILSHISTTAADINEPIFPIHLRWEIGEQEKTFLIPALRDFIEEGNEKFMVGLTNLVNMSPGPIVQANVLVVDRTQLRSISIMGTNTNVNTRPLIDPNGVTFSSDMVRQRGRNDVSIFTGNANNTALNNLITIAVIEGEQVNVTIGLDAPSEYGVEAIDVVVIGADDSEVDPSAFVVLSSARLQWAIGDRLKTLTISAELNQVLEGTRRLIIELRNPSNVKFLPEGPRRIEVLVQDPPVARRFSTIDFGRIFKQRGSTLSTNDPNHNEQELLLRVITDGQVTNTSSLYWLVEMGTIYTDQQNTDGISESINYPNWPNYYFGVNESGDPEGVRLRVTNLGVSEIVYYGNIIPAGSSFEVLLGRNATTIVLPTNSTMLSAGATVGDEGMALSEDTFVEALYRFELVVDIPTFNIIGTNQTSGPHGFQLKTISPEPNVYLIGEFNLPNHPSVAVSSGNALALFSSYSNMRTRFDTTACSNTFVGANRVHNVRVHGLILLSQNSLSSDYISNTIGLRSEFSPICGASSGNWDNLPWVSIPFEII